MLIDCIDITRFPWNNEVLGKFLFLPLRQHEEVLVHQSLKTRQDQEDPVLAKLTAYFDNRTDLDLFREVFRWYYNQPKTREEPIAEEAEKAFALYQKDGTLPDFFEIFSVLLESRAVLADAKYEEYSRMHSPKFWGYVFRAYFGNAPVDDPADPHKYPGRIGKGDTDKRWDELLRIGMPIMRKLDES